MAAPNYLKDPDTPGEPHICVRLLACLIGLPSVCVIRTCRRHKRCYGREAICFHDHAGLARRRIKRLEARLERQSGAGD